METIQIIWIILIIMFIFIEAVTISLWSVWFFLGALLAFLVSLFGPGNIVLQFAVFLIVSVVALLLLRPVAKRLVGNRRSPTNADANIGKVARVTEEVRPEKFGRVHLEGLDWTAKSDCVLPVGSYGRVMAIEGVKLVIEPAGVPEGAEATGPCTTTEVPTQSTE